MTTAYTDLITGPASYSTATGIVITTSLSSVLFSTVRVDVPGPNLGGARGSVTINSPAAGQVTVRILGRFYDKATSVNTSLTGLGGLVSERSTSGGTYVANAVHTHALDHDHAAVTSGGQAGAVGGSIIDLTAPMQIRTHDHSFDPPNHTGNTGAGVSHTHAWDNIYEHNHSITNTETDMTFVELPNGTDLSGLTFNVLAIG